MMESSKDVGEYDEESMRKGNENQYEKKKQQKKSEKDMFNDYSRMSLILSFADRSSTREI